MVKTAANQSAEMLAAAGVNRIYGIAGDSLICGASGKDS
jgi:thiamine pyrophosphate-dependent acetolactate synthase large subunit-like protein